MSLNFSVSFILNLKVEGAGCLPSMHKAMSSILRPLQKKVPTFEVEVIVFTGLLGQRERVCAEARSPPPT